MKSFLKFIITILVISVVGYTMYFCSINGKNYIDKGASGELDLKENIIDSEEIIENNSGDEIIIDDNEIGSGDLNIDFSDSGEIETIISKNEIINNINQEVIIINGGEVLSSSGEKLTLEFVSDDAKEYMRTFNLTELDVTIIIKERCVEIVPMSDFLNNMIYYYDENGKLIMYESVSNTVGGNSRYYFDNDFSVDALHNYEEGIKVQEEYVFDVLNRGNRIYDRYLKK